MNMNILDYVQKTVDYIEKNITDEIKLEKISKSLFLSKFHLDRVFTAAAGVSLVRYITGRKMAMTLEELLNTNLRIVDIAYRYGFRYEQSYIRTFKRQFGITPDAFRSTKCELVITDKINTEHLTAITENVLLSKPVTVIKPSFYLTGIRCHVKSDTDVSKFALEFYENTRHKIPGAVNTHTYYGHCLYDGDYAYYTAGVETAENETSPPGTVKINVPANKYMVFKYTGLHSSKYITYPSFYHIEKAAEELYKVTKFKIQNAYHFEKINNRLCSDNYCELDLYYPVTECT